VNVERDATESYCITDRRVEIVRADERVFRELAFAAVRESLETFAEQGDVQTCAMLALTAPQELRVSRRRIRRFLDSYIDILHRRRLYACAAHLRKFCELDSISKNTLVETIIYTGCGRCKKPIIVPAGPHSRSQLVKGGFAYCLSCKMSSAPCFICRLPIRGLLLQCSICHHGAHQACYRDYYLQPLSPSFGSLLHDDENGRNMEARQVTTDGVSTLSNDGIESKNPQGRIQRYVGRLCVAGCGHRCSLDMGR